MTAGSRIKSGRGAANGASADLGELKASEVAERARSALAGPVSRAIKEATRLRAAADWQSRFFAVLVFGGLAANSPRARRALLTGFVEDDDWRVQEALAKAFDACCTGLGWSRAAVAAVERAIASPHARLRRAVAEGLRPWTSVRRPPFCADPALAIELLGRLRADPDRSVQESVGNALRDIGKRSPRLVGAAVEAWLREDPESTARRTIARHALRGR